MLGPAIVTLPGSVEAGFFECILGMKVDCMRLLRTCAVIQASLFSLIVNSTL